MTMPGTVGAIRRNAVRIAECIGRFAKRNVTGFAIRLRAGAIRPERALVVVCDLHDASPVEAAGIFPQSLWRHSHIRLSDEQFERARALIELVGAAV